MPCGVGRPDRRLENAPCNWSSPPIGRSCKLMRERETHADLPPSSRTIVAGPSIQIAAAANRGIATHCVGWRGKPRSPHRSVLQAAPEIVAPRRGRAGCAAACEVAPSVPAPAEARSMRRKQCLRILERSGDHQRGMVGQHHAAGATGCGWSPRDLPIIGRAQGCDRSKLVMFSPPVTDVARGRLARQIYAVAQRPPGLVPVGTTKGRDRERIMAPTSGRWHKPRPAQSEGAARTGQRSSDDDEWDENQLFHKSDSAHPGIVIGIQPSIHESSK